MRRATWITDIHLNFLWEKATDSFDPECHQFVDNILQTKPDVVLLTGDIAEGPELIRYLT